MRHRLRKPAIPDDDALPPRLTRWTVRVRTIAFSLLGLAVATSLLSVHLTYQAAQESAAQAEAVDRRLAVLEEDLAERTRQRDAERDAAAEEQERFRVNLCVVLGQLSATFPNLDRLRDALGCPPPDDTATPPTGAAPPGTPDAGSSVPDPPGVSAPAAAPAPPPPAPARPTPAPPSEPPRGPGLICGLLPPLC